MRFADQVPVFIKDVRVGSAFVHDNGSIDVHMTPPQPLGSEILEEILKGAVTGLVISPISPPPAGLQPNYLTLKPRAEQQIPYTPNFASQTDDSKKTPQ